MKQPHFIKNLGLTIAKSGLFSSAARSFHSQKSFFLSEDFKKEMTKKLDPVAQEFYEHRALKHPLFDYLSEQSQEGFTPRQFLIYRDNFFRRTQLTIPSIASTIGAAMEYGDIYAAVLAYRNLTDEMGGGDVKNVHSQLLLENHNIHGMRVFGLDPLDRITDVERSKVLLPEVDDYRKAKEEIFKRPYPYVAGNTWAHELAADSMLDNFRKAFFDPYLGLYKPEESKYVMKFFDAHKDDSRKDGDVEQQHEKMAREAVESACLESMANIGQIREGGLIFLSHQEKLWDGLLREVEKAKHVGDVIRPQPMNSAIAVNGINEHDKNQKEGRDSEVPNTSITQAILKKSKTQNNERKVE